MPAKDSVSLCNKRYSSIPLERLSITFTSNANLYHVTKFPLYLSITVHYFYTEISSFTQSFIHRNCSELFLSLLIFSFEKFSTWIWRLPFAVYVKLKLSLQLLQLGFRDTTWIPENEHKPNNIPFFPTVTMFLGSKSRESRENKANFLRRQTLMLGLVHTLPDDRWKFVRLGVP